MSFSSEIKNDLVKIENLASCCNHAQVYGLVLFAHCSTLDIGITTENSEVFGLYKSYLDDYFKIKYDEQTNGRKKLSVIVSGKNDRLRILQSFGYNEKDTVMRINYANFQNDCCTQSFLRGAFLSCGFISNPNTSYHLEFVVSHKKLSMDLLTLLENIGLQPKLIVRKGSYVVYFKNSEDIEDLLAYIGAQNASLYLMNIKIEKDVKNKVNRKLNFEISNIDKVLSASDEQIKAIEHIKSCGKWEILTDSLKEIAELRLANPEASLTELADMLDNNVSRSGIKHRLDRILTLSKEIDK